MRNSACVCVSVFYEVLRTYSIKCTTLACRIFDNFTKRTHTHTVLRFRSKQSAIRWLPLRKNKQNIKHHTPTQTHIRTRTRTHTHIRRHTTTCLNRVGASVPQHVGWGWGGRQSVCLRGPTHKNGNGSVCSCGCVRWVGVCVLEGAVRL